jgi:hypothetical protein
MNMAKGKNGGEPTSAPASEEATSTPAGSGEEETVCGVKIDCVDKGRLARCAKELKIEVPKGAGITDLVEAVAVHFTKERKQGKQMLACDRCGGVAPEALDPCPFCGEPSGGDEGTESSAIGGNSDPDPPSVMERAQQTETALARVERSTLSTTAAAVVVPRKLPPQTEDHLEEVIGELQRLKRSFAENTWQIGQRVLELTRETKDRPALWRLRKEDDGVTQRYKDFKAFLRAEVGFSFRMAENCAYLAETYTEEKLSLVSTSKMEIVLNAPPKEREKLIRSGAAATLPVRQLREKVRELNIKAGKHDKRRAARQERAKRENAAKDEASGVVTFTAPGKKGRIWLYRRAKDATGKLTKAHSLSDNYGWIEGRNGVRLVLSVEKDAAGLHVRWEARRESEDE